MNTFNINIIFSSELVVVTSEQVHVAINLIERERLVRYNIRFCMFGYKTKS